MLKKFYEGTMQADIRRVSETFVDNLFNYFG